MDLFNKKKLAALQDELTLVTANLEATTKELADLKTNALLSYKDLTDYFAPKYEKKYFEVVVDGKTEYFRCDKLQYNGGVICMEITLSGETEKSECTITIPELKQLKITTKQVYLKGGDK